MLMVENLKEVIELLNTNIDTEKAKAISFYEKFSKLSQSDRNYIEGYIQGRLDKLTEIEQQKAAPNGAA